MTQHALRTFFGLACIGCLGYSIAASVLRNAASERVQFTPMLRIAAHASHASPTQSISYNTTLTQSQTPLYTRPPLPIPIPKNTPQPVVYKTPVAAKKPTVHQTPIASTFGDRENISPPIAAPLIRMARFMRANDGHYYANTLINGNGLRMIVDTGATKIALSRGDARKVGYFLKDSDFISLGEGVAGKVSMASITLNRLTLGEIVLSNVPAVVFNAESGPSLLGMNVLNQMNDISINNNAMIIKRQTAR